MTKTSQKQEAILQEEAVAHQKLRVYIIDVVPPDSEAEDVQGRLEELESLVTTYRGIVIVKSIQKRSLPDYRTYVGSGKLEEIRSDMKENNANLLIIGNILKPSQVYAVAEMFRKDNIQVWDRVDLILKIFERHAVSSEARLQIELAAIAHMGPRIFGMGMELSRQGGGTGGTGGRAGRGIGETNTERMRRHLKDKKLVIKKELEKYQKGRALHRTNRIRNDFFTVGIVGYTNAGKSALMHALTGKDILIEDKLFATLGTAVGEMKPRIPQLGKKIDLGNSEASLSDDYYESVVAGMHFIPYKKILINDTIGFIRDLPPDLIEAFSSTLEDSICSQFLLHVIDASDPKIREKIKVVDDILRDIHADQQRCYVFTKIDKIASHQRADFQRDFAEYNPIFVSAFTKEGLEDLKKYLTEKARSMTF